MADRARPDAAVLSQCIRVCCMSSPSHRLLPPMRRQTAPGWDAHPPAGARAKMQAVKPRIFMRSQPTATRIKQKLSQSRPRFSMPATKSVCSELHSRGWHLPAPSTRDEPLARHPHQTGFVVAVGRRWATAKAAAMAEAGVEADAERCFGENRRRVRDREEQAHHRRIRSRDVRSAPAPFRQPTARPVRTASRNWAATASRQSLRPKLFPGDWRR